MAERPYTVVVGVSATSKSPTALDWARARRMPNPQATPSGTPAGRISRADDVEQEARAALERDVAATLGEDHGAELRLVRGSKFTVLLKAAEEADLLVVDAPRQLLAGPMFAHRLVRRSPASRRRC
jgi:hypothetical protein